jgi:hypothetical protein
MPKLRPNLIAALGKQSGTLITEEWPADFYAANGFAPAPNLETVVRQWLEYADQIYFNDTALSQIIDEIRAKNFFDLIVNFIGVIDENTRTIRTQAWRMFVDKMLREPPATDMQRCAEILKILAKYKYGEKHSSRAKEYDAFTLDQYHIAEKNVANIEINSALVVMNISIKEAFNFLTVRNIASAIKEIPVIIHKHLLQALKPEQHKNPLTQALLTYLYRGGVMHALYNAHQQNLTQTNYHLNAKADWAQTTIQLICSENKVRCIEQAPISLLLVSNPELVSIVANVPTDDEDSKDEKAEFPNEVAADSPSLIESMHSVTFEVVTVAQVKISVNDAKSYSYHRQAINLVKEQWQQKLTELTIYARLYVEKQQHDKLMQTIIFKKYPEIAKEQTTSKFFTFYSQPAEEEKGRQLFEYLGRNAPEFIVEQSKLLKHYALQGEGQFTFAIKLLRELGAHDVVKEALSSYLDSKRYMIDQPATNEDFVRNAYRFMRGHGVFIVYQLLADMQFYNATVLTQHPPGLLQFDKKGKLSLERKLDLKSELPLCAKTYLKVYRYVGLVEFIKPKLTIGEYDELNNMIISNSGIALNSVREYFEYPEESDQKNENIIPLSPLPLWERSAP